MDNHLDRIMVLKGSPYQAGFSAGQKLAGRLEGMIEHYLTSQPIPKDMQKLHEQALPWLRSLPPRFQQELEGLAEGACVPLQRLAEFTYIEECDAPQCSGAVVCIDHRLWVARNNDTFVPDLWGYATIRELEGRIPTITFSLEGDVFAPTGINQDRLWLHYNFLLVWDKPSPGKPHVPGYVFIVEALEQCHSLGEVERLLDQVDRDGGMLLFAVDGKTNECALYECLSSTYYKRELQDGWIVGTNHFCACEDRTLSAVDEQPSGTLSRYRRLEQLVQEIACSAAAPKLPDDLVRILADDAIERRNENLMTAYSNVACPQTGELWYTFGGYPSASRGNWHKMDWPWRE